MYSSNQLVLAQNLDQRPTNMTKAYLAKQEEWRQWCLKKEFGDGELVNDQKLSFFMMDHVMNRGHRKESRFFSRRKELYDAINERAELENISPEEAAQRMENDQVQLGISLDKYRA
ncbi:hypothetical protein PHYBLDRAFT_70998 [Phycomyces blakesleeanus NRRL 1555(-)]|uniref:Transcription activator GCR1-like domain-containing protein n=1 Tax=Phycomyces blakesleeanus (strain ATCC 8743b / DSM 1359 / FGSC 10004 / NBRC 33097 / NRRL 1555) TaxID=763407 RepID=A0A162N2Y8_PHYB8|nr:hypothetical protein PHYBLDRAFT_70998 [Phycomyces blakesleeanus NRRL 1555(-)]OAD65334.1 hypothetical protein PHYBLDRAFT_70998 [Phycomyces blakesleeanus NRRL 1555(-)]|eukprot:XP_018283374.1 hypothetical protein PHYBLDRAFT_70998 [Phycomyces blakesleeanus NRRL 1555(-)]